MAAGSIIVDLTLNSGSFETDTQRASSAVTRMGSAIDKQVQALQAQIATFGLSERETTLYTLAQKGATQWDLARADAALKQVDALKQVAAAQQQATAAADAASRSLPNTAAASSSAPAAVAAAATALPAAANAQQFLDSLKKTSEEAGKTKTELLAMQAAQLGVTNQAKPLIDAIAKASEATHEFGFNTARSKTELLVLAHELSQGNFQKFGGSIGVLAEQTGAASILFSGLGLAIIGVTAAVGGLAAAFVVGAQEQKALQDAILLTGNAAGMTESGVSKLATSIASGLSGVTVRGAAQTLADLIGSGKLAGDSLKSVATASLLFQNATGQSAEAVDAAFVKGANDVVKFATETNQQYHFLSASQVEYIKNLDETGQHQAAVSATFDAFAGRLVTQANNIGLIGHAWDTTKKALSGYLDAVLSIGKTPVGAADLAAEQAHLANLKSLQARQQSGTTRRGTNASIANAAAGTLVTDADIAAQQAIVDSKSKEVAASEQLAAANAKDATLQQNKLSYAKDLEQYQTRAVERQKIINKLVADAANANGLDPVAAIASIKAGANPNTIDPKLGGAIAEVNARFKDRSTSTKGQVTDQDFVKIDIAKIQAKFKQVTDAYSDTNDVISALHSAGLSDEKDFQAQRVTLIQSQADTQVKLLQDENARYQKFIDSHKGDKTQSKSSEEDSKAISVNETKIQEIRDKTLSQLAVLKIQTDAYLASIQVGYLKAGQAAEESLRLQTLSDTRAVQAQRLSPEQASQVSGRNAVSDKFDTQAIALENTKSQQQLANKLQGGDGSLTSQQQQDYATQLALLTTFKAKELAEYDDGYAKRKAGEADWTNGAVRSMQTYVDAVANTSKLTEDLFTHAFSGIEDSLTSLITTGKGGLKALTDSIAADIVRLSVKFAESKAIQFVQGTDTAKSIGLGATNVSAAGGSFGTSAQTTAVSASTTAFTGLTTAATAAAQALASVAAAGGVSSAGGAGNLLGGIKFGSDSGAGLGNITLGSANAGASSQFGFGTSAAGSTDFLTNAASAFNASTTAVTAQTASLAASTAATDVQATASSGAADAAVSVGSKLGGSLLSAISSAATALVSFAASSLTSSTASTVGTVSKIASYDVGTPFVPNDQIAKVHKGEMIVPAPYAKDMRYDPAAGGTAAALQGRTSTAQGNTFVVHQNFTVQGSPPSKQTQMQLAAAAAQGIQRGRRNL